MQARAVHEAIQRHRGVSNMPVIDGPRLERFDPMHLAGALEQELARAAQVGWTKISIHLDVEDAMRLEQYLRRG